MDVALWDRGPDAPVLAISSRTQGVEGYCGSFVQCALLEEGLAERSAPRCSLVMVHAINPYGFAWQRRVNGQNVECHRAGEFDQLASSLIAHIANPKPPRPAQAQPPHARIRLILPLSPEHVRWQYAQRRKRL